MLTFLLLEKIISSGAFDNNNLFWISKEMRAIDKEIYNQNLARSRLNPLDLMIF